MAWNRTICTLTVGLGVVAFACTNQSTSAVDVPGYAIFHGSRDVYETGNGVFHGYDGAESEFFFFRPAAAVERELEDVRNNLADDGWAIIETPQSGSRMFEAVASDGSPCVRYIRLDAGYKSRIAADEVLSQIDIGPVRIDVDQHREEVAAIVTDVCQ
jgi:hypothetical protein